MWGVPFGLGLTLFAGDFVHFVLGDKWHAAIFVMQIFGSIEPLSVAALLTALVVSLATAAVTAMFVVMVSEIYTELAGRDAATVSVPSSGT